MFSSSRIPKEDCPLNVEYILSVCTLFLFFETPGNDLPTKSQCDNSFENIEPNVVSLVLVVNLFPLDLVKKCFN